MSDCLSRRGLLHAVGGGLAGTALSAIAAHDGFAAPAKKLSIALSNSYIGNKWRIEMENVFGGAGDGAVQIPGRGHLVQLRQ